MILLFNFDERSAVNVSVMDCSSCCVSDRWPINIVTTDFVVVEQFAWKVILPVDKYLLEKLASVSYYWFKFVSITWRIVEGIVSLVFVVTRR